MDLNYSPAHQDFQAEVRAFLAAHRHLSPTSTRAPRDPVARAWQKLLIAHGYAARSIPQAYGGAGLAPDLLK
jgi:alkylation response protein AidB-like acyl-CoA dehydrogenase